MAFEIPIDTNIYKSVHPDFRCALPGLSMSAMFLEAT